jgi:hypothetical protein
LHEFLGLENGNWKIENGRKWRVFEAAIENKRKIENGKKTQDPGSKTEPGTPGRFFPFSIFHGGGQRERQSQMAFPGRFVKGWGR